MKPIALLWLGAALGHVGAAAAQQIPRVDVGWGVDTAIAAWSDVSWHRDVPAVFALWRDYLLEDAYLRAPTKRWSSAEQERWRAYDLTAGIAYKGMPATVVDIRPSGEPGNELVVRTLFASASAGGGVIRPVALTRVYAVREDDRWVFSNALPRLTRDWQREAVGPLTYVIDPALSFDRERAERAVAFADSLAQRLSVPPIDSAMYVVAGSPEELHRVMGVDWTFGGQGHGYAIPWNRMILSGDAEFREANRHELVHYMMAPVLQSRSAHPLINEGIATWLGGTVGRPYAALVREYADYLRDQPDVTLDLLLQREGPDRGWYPAGAMLVDMVHERRGWAGVNELIRSGRSDDELRAALMRLLDATWEQIGAAWRAKAIGARPLSP